MRAVLVLSRNFGISLHQAKSMDQLFKIDLSDPASLQRYLLRKKWLKPGEQVMKVEKPGEGNMNCVVRVITADRSFIVKQARNYVEKYPSIAAPTERAVVEAAFYQTAQKNASLKESMAEMINFDSENFILKIEDLGRGADYTFLYQPETKLTRDEAVALGHYLGRLHQIKLAETGSATFPSNFALRKLNHEHIFIFSYSYENGFDLDTLQPGLEDVARRYRQDEVLKKNVTRLGEWYLSRAGTTLVHGDFYPGSWLKIDGHLKVIDPEFSFPGWAEFDFGVMMAHAHLANLSAEVQGWIDESYARPAGFDEKLANAVAGMEIIRRLIGLAQLPLVMDLHEKSILLETARTMVLENCR